jgi:hypothetical protein
MANQQNKAPDNNKRLKQLEAGVSALAIALTANGVEISEGADPFELAVGRVKHAAQLDDRLMALIGATTGVIGRFAPDMELAPKDAAEPLIDVQIRLLEQLATHETPCDLRIRELEDKLGATTAELENARSTSAELEGGTTGEDATAALEDQIDELERTIKVRDARIAELEAGAPVIVQAPPGDEDSAVDAEPAPLVRPETARDVGPDYPGTYSSEEITKLLASGEAHPLEIAFSNGAYEIVALQSVPIDARDLLLFEGRNVVGPSVSAKLSQHDAAEDLHGFGLLLGGEQIAYCPLLDPLRLQPGTERRFDRAIYF